MRVSPAGSYHLFNFRGHSFHVSLTYGLLLLFIIMPGRGGGGVPIDGLLAALAVTISILWHELGHAFMFKRSGCGPSQIILHGFGGMTQPIYGGQLTRGEAMATSAAGPLAGLLLAIPFVALSYFTTGQFFPPRRSPLEVFIAWMVFVNVIWSIFNLFPIYPLDGGQILLRFIGKWARRPARVTAITSFVVIVPLALWALQGGATFLFIVLALLAFESYQLLMRSR